jgi:Zn-dependent protease
MAGHGTNETLIGLAFLGAVFTCVILHELGHALAAKYYKIKTIDIHLLPIGGVARMETLPEKPKQELIVSIMGPLVNVFISCILFIVLNLSHSFSSGIKIQDLQVISKSNFWISLFTVNLFLALFNLIPAFPMDGGRIFRAILSFKFARVKATHIAARLGQFIAVMFIFFGFSANPMLVFIGLFVFFSALTEDAAEETKSYLTGLKVSDVLMQRYSILQWNDPLSSAISLLLDSQEQSFVVQENEEIKGTLSLKEMIIGLKKFGKETPIKEVIKKEAPSLQISDSLDDVMQRFIGSNNEFLLVFDEKKFAGVLDLENILEYISIQNAIKKC